MDAYDVSENFAKMRFVGSDAKNCQAHDPWGWFKMIKISENIIALESQRYPGYILETYIDT